MYPQMSSVQRISGSLLRIHSVASLIGRNSMRIVPVHSIMYISVFDRCLDIQYADKRVDTLHFSTNVQRDRAADIVEECFGKEKTSLVKDYPYADWLELFEIRIPLICPI